ncbi:SpoIIE family protein phosphatase [Streptomyces sp. NBC_01613]|uniref:SpoIIE family protein phosphatase n=1 Tax=Streptomyces sp. NBC_01613 TaxID=2975896 RepID=UPI00386B354B
MARDAPLMVVDGEGMVVQWSHEAEELLGRTAAEVIGLSATYLVSRAAASSRHGTNTGPDAVLQHRDGRAVDADLRVRPVLRRDGSVAWAVFQVPANGTTGLGAGSAVLEALFTNAPVGLHVLDKRLRIMSANDAGRAMCGATGDRILGRRLTDVYGLSSPGEVETMLRGVLESGAPATGLVVRMQPEGVPGRGCSALVSAFRLQDSLGACLGVAAAVADVTEYEKTRARLQVLAAVREGVGRTLNVVASCQELVEAVVPGFADVVVVEVVDAVLRGEDPPLSPLGRDVPLRRVAFGGREEEIQAHPVGDVRSLPFSTPYARALADLKPRVAVLDSGTPWLAADPARAEAIRASGVRTLLAAPLALRGRVLGLVSLYRTEQSGHFDEREVALTLELAAHTALCIDNARRYTREHTIATTLQRRLLPPCPSSQSTVESAHLLVPGDEGGGGWFDTFALSSARTALVVGEVTGQGIHAATTMGQLRTVIHSLASLDLDADELLARLNDTAILLAEERAALPPGDPLHREALTASCVYAIYDPLTRTCTFARAGHPAPVIARPDGTTDIPDSPTGPLLGSSGGQPFDTATVTLIDGSILAFYTTSLLPVSPAGEPDDASPLRRVLADPDRPLQDLCDDALYRLHGDARPGDAVLLLGRTHTFPSEHVATWQLVDAPTAAGTARTHTRRQLADWGVDEETAYATELIVSELVTNALHYGTPPLQLRIIKDRALTCEVQDTGLNAPRLRHARTVDEGGRGLFIVAQLSQNWGTRYTPAGKTVWTEQLLSSQPR